MSCRPGTSSRASAPAISPMTMMLTMSPSMVCLSCSSRGRQPVRPLRRATLEPPLGRVRHTPRGVTCRCACPSPRSRPITVALVDDYDVVLTGVAHMFDQYRDRVVVAEIDANKPVERRRRHRAVRLVRAAGVRPRRDRRAGREPAGAASRGLHLELPPGPVDSARRRACTATCPRRCRPATWSPRSRRSTPARSWSATPPRRAAAASGLDWPGRGEGLTDRESEILALITQGKSNAEVAALTYLSPNTVKSYIRTLYRKIGVASRTQAVLWGVATASPPTTTASTTGAAAPDPAPAPSRTRPRRSRRMTSLSSSSASGIHQVFSSTSRLCARILSHRGGSCRGADSATAACPRALRCSIKTTSSNGAALRVQPCHRL